MCTYLTALLPVEASAKGPQGWFRATKASVYLDHPVDLPAEHALELDLLAPDLGPSARVAVELDPASALSLAQGILSVLARVPRGLVPEEVAARARALDDRVPDDRVVEPAGR